MFGQGPIIGLAISVVVGTLIVLALVRRWLQPPELTTLIAGMAAAAVTVLALTFARAGLPGINFKSSSRYLQFVGIPLVMAAVPALAVIARRVFEGRPHGRTVRALPAVLVVVAFLLGLSPLRTYARTFEDLNVYTRQQVRAATVVIDQGCPSGEAPDPASYPVFVHSQITTQLLQLLVDRGQLSVAPADEFDPVVADAMCPSP